MFPRRKPSLWTRSPTCAASPGTVVPLRTETVTSRGLSGGWWAARPLPDAAFEWVEDELAPPTWLTANARAPPMISTPVTARTRYSGRPRSTRRYQGSAGAREKGREVAAREPPTRPAVRGGAAPPAAGGRPGGAAGRAFELGGACSTAGMAPVAAAGAGAAGPLAPPPPDEAVPEGAGAGAPGPGGGRCPDVGAAWAAGLGAPCGGGRPRPVRGAGRP